MTTYTSTIDANIPADKALMSSAQMRANFAAAKADVNALAAQIAAAPAPIVALSGDVQATTDGVVTVKKLNGVAPGAAGGPIVSDLFNRLPASQLPLSAVGAMKYQGTWDAAANVPALASGQGTQGFVFKVSAAGATNLDGITQWNVGDEAVFNGSTWDKWDGLSTEALTADVVAAATAAANALAAAAANQTTLGTALPRVYLIGDGDSRMYNNTGSNAGYRFNNGTIVQAQAATGERHTFDRRLNLGTNGATIQGMLDNITRYDALLAQFPPDAEFDVVGEVGINDATAGTDAVTFGSKYAAYVDAVLARGVRNFFMLGEVPYPQLAGESPATHAASIALLKAYNAQMQAIAASRGNVIYVDCYNAFGGGTDVPTYPQYQDKHYGTAGALIRGGLLAAALIQRRGRRTGGLGASLAKNPELTGAPGSDPDGFYNYGSPGATLSRSGAAFRVALAASGGVAAYNAFASSETLNGPLMPGDVVQGVLRKKTVSTGGTVGAVGMQLRLLFKDASNNEVASAWANNDPSGYDNYALPGDVLTYATEPYTVPAGGPLSVARYLQQTTPDGSAITEDILYAGIERVFTSPNAQYSASAAIPVGRRHVAAFTFAAGAAITLTLPALAAGDDGEVITIFDAEFAAASNPVTVAAAAGDAVLPMGQSATTAGLVRNQSGFRVAFRRNRARGAWVQEASNSYGDLAGVPSVSSQLVGLATAKQFSSSDYFFYNQGGTARQMPFNTFAAGTGVCISWFGDPTGSNDTTTIQAATTAAVNGPRVLIVDDPTGNGTQWYAAAGISDPSGKLSAPRVTAYDTATGIITFDRNHGLKAGDVASFTGSPGIGVASRASSYTEYFVSVASSTSVKLYANYANALAGGATGLILPDTGFSTTATFNTAVLASPVTIASGTNTATLVDASALAVNDYLNFTGAGGSAYYKISAIAGNVVTFPATGSGGTFAAGATVYTSSVSVASPLSIESGTTVTLTGPTAGNSNFGSFVVESVTGNTLHLNQPPNSGTLTPGTSYTLNIGFWLDQKHTNTKFTIRGMPGAIIRKTGGFSGTAIFTFSWGANVDVIGLELWGKSIGYRPDPGIVDGDDGIRFFGCNSVHMERCTFKYCGDSAWRTHSSSFWVGARSATYPNAGTYSNNIRIIGCYVYDCFQVSTTNTSNFYMGGSHNYWADKNIFEKIGGSVKFATRAPGSSNVYLEGNIVEGSGRHGFELDSYTNYQIHRNTIYNCAKYGISIIANDKQQIGFEFHEAKLTGNIIKGGPDTGLTSSSGGIYIATDLYPDGTRWDYRGLHVIGNEFYDLPGQSLPFSINNGSFRGLRVQNNTVESCANTSKYFNLLLRPSTDPNFDANIMISGNIARRPTGSKATMFYVAATTAVAGSYVRGIQVSDNQFNSMDASLGSSASNDGRFFYGDYLQDVRIYGNRWNGYGTNAVYIQNEGKDVAVNDNDFVNLNTAAGVIVNLNNVDGVLVHSNKVGHNNASSNWLALDRRCQNVRIGPNDLVRTVASRRGVSTGNVPYKTAENGYQTRQDWVTAAPSAGTYDAGDRYLFAAPAANTSQGGICTTGGTYTAITATGDSTAGSNVIANILSMTNIARGMYLTHPGFTGTLRVADMTTNSVTVTTAAGAATTAASTTTAQSLAVSAPVFKAMPAIAA